MVGHQTVGIEIKGPFCFLLSEHTFELEVVVVRTKDLAAIISAADDVIETAGDLDPWFSSHRESLLLIF